VTSVAEKVPTQTAAAAEPLVRVEHLTRHFHLGSGRAKRVVHAVDDVSFELERGTTLGLVGESGSGKSTLARLLLRLDQPTSGRVLFGGEDLFGLGPSELRRRRRDMQIVFQEPFASLNQRKTVEQIVSFPLRVHDPSLTRTQRAARVGELMELVGQRPEHARAYPRQLSGGQCQRVSIARALALGPKLVVLDEAVSAVDVSIQAQILNLLKDLQRDLGLAYLFVAHDLAVVRAMSDRIAVMNKGVLVETGDADEVYRNPQQDYTRALLAAVPVPDPRRMRERKRERRKLSHAVAEGF
jgi:oligopeptide transport system ATP-binding protein